MFNELRQAVEAAIELHARARVIHIGVTDQDDSGKLGCEMKTPGWGEVSWEEKIPAWSKWYAITDDACEWQVRHVQRRIRSSGGETALPPEAAELRFTIKKTTVWPAFASCLAKRAAGPELEVVVREYEAAIAKR